MPTIHFKPPQPPPPLSLGERLGVHGNIKLLPQSGFWVLAEENEAELIEVAIVKKRKLHVVTDRMLKARQSMDEPVEGNFNFRGAYA